MSELIIAKFGMVNLMEATQDIIFSILIIASKFFISDIIF